MSAPIRESGSGAEDLRSSSNQTVARDAILDQLKRILESPPFIHSKRCGPLLKYLVSETLDGRAELLKERTIGVGVFGRQPTYDTNDDPIVRTSAVEVRKRIAQYYHDPAHASELRIGLTLGSYVPTFRAAVVELPARCDEESTGSLSNAAGTASQSAASRNVLFNWVTRRFAYGAALAGIAIAAVLFAYFHRPARPLEAFWSPLLGSGTVTLVMGNSAELEPSGVRVPAASDTSFIDAIRADHVGFADGLTLARVVGLISREGARFEIRRGGSLTLLDLRKGPAVLVGTVDNPWTSVFQQRMRFHFVFDPQANSYQLMDRQNPGSPLWTQPRDIAYSKVGEDRAIVSRFVDARTEQSVLLLAGLGKDATAAAGEFVTDARYLSDLAARAPSGWARKNLQVVIATDLINGHSGPPRIVYTYAW